jgi:hypothetical protein
MPRLQTTITFRARYDTPRWQVEKAVEEAAQELQAKLDKYATARFTFPEEATSNDPLAELFSGLAEIGAMALDERRKSRRDNS